MSLRKKPTFEELLSQSREEILQDEQVLEQIDEKIENRINASFKKDA
ncbi:FbpB family small basic protein [Aquibacillus albus]